MKLFNEDNRNTNPVTSTKTDEKDLIISKYVRMYIYTFILPIENNQHYIFVSSSTNKLYVPSDIFTQDKVNTNTTFCYT